MALRQTIAVAGIAALSFAGAATAQVPPPNGPRLYAPPPRIEIYPRPVYRRCAVRYVVQYRPSGPVLFPEKHCWWQRG
jgi:hypothetical protein